MTVINNIANEEVCGGGGGLLFYVWLTLMYIYGTISLLQQ